MATLSFVLLIMAIGLESTNCLNLQRAKRFLTNPVKTLTDPTKLTSSVQSATQSQPGSTQTVLQPELKSEIAPVVVTYVADGFNDFQYDLKDKSLADRLGGMGTTTVENKNGDVLFKESLLTNFVALINWFFHPDSEISLDTAFTFFLDLSKIIETFKESVSGGGDSDDCPDD